MKTLNLYLAASLLLLLVGHTGQAQPLVKIGNGIIFVGNYPLERNERRYAPLIDSLDHKLKVYPNDTISLFYRALFYCQYNNFVINPDLSTGQATDKLLLARKMVERADSLKMQSLYLKVLKAQICKELTNRYAPIETWRFNAQQIADRKKKFEYYKALANKYYDEVAVIDKKNAWDYQKLKVKDK